MGDRGHGDRRRMGGTSRSFGESPFEIWQLWGRNKPHPGKTSGKRLERSFATRQAFLDPLPSISSLLPSMWVEGREGVLGENMGKGHPTHCPFVEETVLQGSGSVLCIVRWSPRLSSKSTSCGFTLMEH